MKALKTKNSSDDNPQWGILTLGEYNRIDHATVPYFYNSDCTMKKLVSLIIIASDKRQAISEWELVDVDITIKRNLNKP